MMKKALIFRMIHPALFVFGILVMIYPKIGVSYSSMSSPIRINSYVFKDTVQSKPVKHTRGPNDTIPVYRIAYQGDSIPWILMGSVEITRERVFSNPEAKARFLRLRHDVLKVLPYAQFAQERYDQMHSELEQVTRKKDQKKLIKSYEKEIRDMFNREVKKLTVTQGKILLKLIDRQTGSTSYEVVKDLKGGLNAFMFQSMAKVFGHDLKSEYDPRIDFEIENILKSLNNHPQYGNMVVPVRW